MPIDYAVKVGTSPSPFGGALADVQQINVIIGRQRTLDIYSASRATITLRYPTGYASPNALIKSGNFVKIDGYNRVIFEGKIDNVDVQYGIPFVSNVGNADFLTFTAEGSFAVFGRAQGEDYAMSAGTLADQLTECANETNEIVVLDSAVGNGPQMAATTISGTWGEWLNKVLITINGRMQDTVVLEHTNLLLYSTIEQQTINFSDTTNNATNQVYDVINFGSYADNYYTQVTVTPESFAAQTVESGSAPFRTLQTNTLNASTGQASDFANYLLGAYDTQSFALLSISALAEAQNSFQLDEFRVADAVKVTFRGTTFDCVIEGIDFTADPVSSRYTFHLSGADLNRYFILNSTTFGILNTNQLGY